MPFCGLYDMVMLCEYQRLSNFIFRAALDKKYDVDILNQNNKNVVACYVVFNMSASKLYYM